MQGTTRRRDGAHPCSSVARARHYGEVARDALGIFPDSPIKQAMIDVIDFCIDRGF